MFKCLFCSFYTMQKKTGARCQADGRSEIHRTKPVEFTASYFQPMSIDIRAGNNYL